MTDQHPLNIIFLLDNPFISDLRVEKEALGLSKIGHRVTIVCTHKKSLPLYEERQDLTIKRLIPDCYNRPYSKDYKLRLKDFATRISKMEFDVIHCHDSAMLRIGFEIKKLKPKSVLIYDTHEYLRGWKYYQDIQGVFSKFKGYLVWRYFLKFERKACESIVDRIITTTIAISNQLATDYKLSKKPVVLRNLTSLKPNAHNNPTSLRSKLNIPMDHLIMVQSGNIYQRMDEIERMFEVSSHFENLHYVIINNRPIANRLKELISNNPKKYSRIHLVDYDSSNLLEFLQSADFGVLYMRSKEWESHYLTSPNRIYEYTQADLPFISVPQTSSEELASEFGHVVFFEQLDYSSLKSAISQMIDQLDTYKTNARGAVLKWDDEFNSVSDLYKSVAEKKKSV